MSLNCYLIFLTLGIMLWRNHRNHHGLQAFWLVAFFFLLTPQYSYSAVQSDSTSAQMFEVRYAKTLALINGSVDESSILSGLKELEKLSLRDTSLAFDYGYLWSRYAVWQLRNKNLSDARSSIFDFTDHVQSLGLKGAYSRANASIGHYYLAIDDHAEARRSYLTTIAMDKAAGRDCQSIQANAFNCLISFGSPEEVEDEFNQLVSDGMMSPRLKCTVLSTYMNYLMERPDAESFMGKLDELMDTVQSLDPETLINQGGPMGIYNLASARYWFLKGEHDKALVYTARYGRSLRSFEVEKNVAHARGDFELMNSIIDNMAYVKDSLARGHVSITQPSQVLHSHARLKWQNEDLQNMILREQTKQLQRQYQLERSRLNMELMEQESANARLASDALAAEIEASELEASILAERAANEELSNKERTLHAQETRNRLIGMLVLLMAIILGILWAVVHKAQKRLEISAKETMEAERVEKILMRDSVIAEAAAELALEEAKMANEKALAFLMTVSHEVRTPLNAIMGANQILASKDLEVSDSERKSLIKGTRENSRFLTDLISKVLHLSRMESGCYNPVVTDFSLGDVCDEVISDLHQDDSSAVQVVRCPLCSSVKMSSDREVVKSVLAELVDNACKFTPSGSVKITSEVKDGNVSIAVTDTGIGISKADAQRIFDPFEKLDSFVAGIGLGLAFCRSAAMLLGGGVALDQDYPGPGSRFVLTLPVALEKEVQS